MHIESSRQNILYVRTLGKFIQHKSQTEWLSYDFIYLFFFFRNEFKRQQPRVYVYIKLTE